MSCILDYNSLVDLAREKLKVTQLKQKKRETFIFFSKLHNRHVKRERPIDGITGNVCPQKAKV